MTDEITQFPDESRNEEVAMRAFLCLEDKKQLDRIENSLNNISLVVSEAERRGYERAMEEVREAVIGTVRFTVDQGSEKEEDVDTWCIPKSFFAQPMTPQPEVTYTKQQAALINAVFQEAISSPDVSPDVATIINKSQKWLEKRTI